MNYYHRNLLKLFGIVGLLAPSTVQAQNLLTNGSFEDGTFSVTNFLSLNPGATNITGWTIFSRELAWLSGSFADASSSDGDKYLDLTGLHDGSGPHAGVQQTIATQIGTAYRFEFDLGYRVGADPPVSLQASAGANSSSYTFTYTGTGTGQQWQRFGMDFVATSNSTLISLLGQTGGVYIGLDNVSVTTASPIPEPAFYQMSALLAMGGLALFRKMRRKA